MGDAMHDSQHDYERFVAPIEEDMIRAIWSVCRSVDEAEEAMQEALCTIWGKLGRIRRHPNPKALVLRICLNAAYDVLRRKIRERERASHVPRLSNGAASPSDALLRKERESVILQAIAQLSRKQSTAILLRLVQDASYDEIATTLGCRASTARKHVERGRRRLQDILTPQLKYLKGETV